MLHISLWSNFVTVLLFVIVGDPIPERCSVRSWCDMSSVRSFMVSSFSYVSFQPVLHDCCNKGRAMYYLGCGMMHKKEPLLLIGKSSPCGGSGFLLSLFLWYITICLVKFVLFNDATGTHWFFILSSVIGHHSYGHVDTRFRRKPAAAT